MIAEITLGKVLFALQDIRGEPAITLRRYRFRTYVEEIEDTEELYLLNLILSFQLSEFVHVGRSKFNDLPPPRDIGGTVAKWLVNQDRREYIKLPKLLQTMLEFMTLPKSLHLTKTDVAEVIRTYVDPYKWIAANTLPPKKGTEFCHFCGISEVFKYDLCDSCEYGITSFIEARHRDFLVEVNHRNCYWAVMPSTPIREIDYHRFGFHIVYEGDNMFSYEVESGSKTQLGFDFEEYQRDSE